MAERPRDACSSFKRVGHFEAKFQVKGLRFAPRSMDRQMGNDYTITLPLEVFTQRRPSVVADFIRLKLSFVFHKPKYRFEPPFGGLRGNVHTPWLVRKSVHGRLPIRHNETFFCYFLRLRRYLQLKSVKLGVFRREVGHIECKFQTEGGVTHQLLLVSENESDCAFVWYQNIRSAYSGFVAKHTCERQTDGQNYDSQDRARIAASRGKNQPNVSALSCAFVNNVLPHNKTYCDKTEGSKNINDAS